MWTNEPSTAFGAPVDGAIRSRAGGVTLEPPRRIAYDGAELEYQERGVGEPLLLIHGSILADAFASMQAEPALTDHYRVISYHRRGFAGSSRPTGDVSIARQAADARAILAHLGVARAHVAGQSYGGAIALQLALDAPETVHSLALLEPAIVAAPSAEQFFADVVAPAIGQFQAGDTATAIETFLSGIAGEQALADIERTLPGAIALAVEDADTFFRTELPALEQWNFGPEQARRITQPVLAVLGAESDPVTPVFGEEHALLREWLPWSEPFILPDATHALQIMNPRGMAEGLAGFLARHPMAIPV